ncbi:MAG: PKD domain-containing protein [Verrucomicrobiales bacterium]|nr:PKD domain-containing protein [Verrucomicrobiales bacterium]
MKAVKWSLAGLAVFFVCLSFWPTGGKSSAPVRVATRPGEVTATPVVPGPALLSYKAAEANALSVPQTVTATSPEAQAPQQRSAGGPASPQTAFAGWVERYLEQAWGGDQAALLEEGEALAIARRTALEETIQANPRAALEQAVPYRWRQLLPETITRHFEETVSGLARYDVFMACPLPGADYHLFKHTTYRYATLAGRQYRAYVYGGRTAQMSHPSLPLHGIAVGDVLAVHEEPARVVESEEAQVRVQAGGLAGKPACLVCGGSSTSPKHLDVAGSLVEVCSGSHADAVNRALMGPEVASAALFAGLPTWTTPPPEPPVGTYGVRRALYMRLVFRDDTTIPISEAQALAEMDEVNNFYIENSYSKTAVITTVTPVLTLPHPKAWYSKNGPGSLMADATAEAAKAGYAQENFELVLARFTPVPGYNWGGLGGGKNAWLQYNGAGLAIHEIGHCYGLGHANFWDTRRAALPNPPPDRFDVDSVIGHDSIIGAGDDIEYGDPFDVMGGGGGEYQGAGTGTGELSGFSGHFNPIGKRNLQWLPASGVLEVSASGTNRIHVFDTPVLGENRAYALTVQKDAQRTYWVSARHKIHSNPRLTNGVSLHWSAWPQMQGSYSTLLDTTPGTAEGKDDSPIAVGRTYADDESRLYITPFARGGAEGETWYDIVVHFGPVEGNAPPQATLTATTNRVARNRPVTFTVNAVDPNDDPLSYYWDVSDGSFGANGPTLTRTWAIDGDYRVRVEVSDMKGGKVSRHMVVRVGTPTNSFRISGVVVDDKGEPLADVRVANGAITNNTELDVDFQSTFTDSDGRFTLINQTPGDKEVTAFLHGYVTTAQNFNQIVTVDQQHVEGLEFLALAQRRVTVEVLQHANLGAKTPGTFRFTRTGDTNTDLRVVYALGGTATTNDFIAPTNRTTHTNALQRLLGDASVPVPFYLLYFPTGVLQTNLTIMPAPSATGAEEKTLRASVMYALQKEFTYMTNVDDGEGGQVEALATNYIFLTGWEVLPVNGQDTWVQTYGEYVVGSPGDATMRLQGVPASTPTISLVAVDPAASENRGDSALFLLLRTGRTNVPVDVRLGFGGTATYDADYVPLPVFVTIPAGVTVVRLPLYVRPDLYLEGNETVEITIQPDPAYRIGTASASVVIGDNDLPTLTVVASDAVASELGNDRGAVTFTRLGDLHRALTVNYLAGGTAVSGRDYRSLPGTLTIPAGQPSVTLTIEARNNNLQDGGNTLDIILSDSPTYNVGSPGVATVFIQDGALPTVFIRAIDDTAAEPNDPGEFLIFRAGSMQSELVVELAVGGTARPVADYGPITSLGRIPAGATSVVVRVSPVNDQIREDPETVICEILPSPNYNRSVIVTNMQATITINDDDGSGPLGVGFTFLNSSVVEGSLTGLVAVSVSANPPEGQDVTVDWKVTGGTAIPGVDYIATNTSGRLLFTNVPDPAISNRVLLIPFPVLDDTVPEPSRTVVFTLVEPAPLLSNEFVTNEITLTNELGETIGTTNVIETNVLVIPIPMNAVMDVYRAHTLTILDDDVAEVSLEVVEPLAYEEGRREGLIRIRRVGSLAQDLEVKIGVAGTASNGSDYETVPGRVVIRAGEDAYELRIIPVDDPMQEFMESVVITLIEAPGARLGSNVTGVVNIVDNDGTVEFSSPSYTAFESSGRAEITLRRTSATNSAASVAYTAVAGTATAGDFYPTNGIVAFAPGETLKSFFVDLIDDRIVELPKTVELTLRNLSDGVPLGGQNTATLTILDDDTLVELRATRINAIENDPIAEVTVYRFGIITNLLRVELVATTNGTAIDGVDFTAANYALVFQPGQTSVVAPVALLDDVEFDGEKILPVVLTNLDLAATYGTNIQGEIVIRDDECALQLTATEYSVDEYARTLTVQVERTGSTVHPVQVRIDTQDGTATVGRDYAGLHQVLTFAGDALTRAQDGTGVLVLQPGEALQSVDIRILDDRIGEGNEVFYVQLRDVRTVGGVGQPGTVVLGTNVLATVTIVDNETPGSVDFEFNPGTGANDTVLTLALQVDAKVVLGGRFTELDQVSLNRIARLHDDGYLDTFLNPGEGFDDETYALALQPDGRILVGGRFTRFDTTTVNRLARLNADGALDPDFAIGSGASAPVRALAVESEGTLLVGGEFSTLSGQSRQRLARLRPTGALDPDFRPLFDGTVRALAVQTDGQILVGGSFRNVSSASRPYLVRLNPDGTVQTGFASGNSPDGDVHAIALEPNGRILIAGAFRNLGSVPRRGVARLNADGSLDTSFSPGSGINGTAYAIGVAGDGKVLLGGEFTTYNEISRNRIVRLNPNGTVDTGFDVGSGANGTIYTLVVQPDTAVLIGGDFTVVKGLPRHRIARLHGDEKFTVNVFEFSASLYRVKEDEGPAVITVLRSGDLTVPAQVDYFTSDGTATAGLDYETARGTLAFAAGVTERTFEVPILNDQVGEGDETVFLTLTNLPPGFTTVARLRATLVIEDDESAVAFALANYTVKEDEGQASISVRRTGPTDTVVTVDYATRDGTAIAGQDYVAAAGTLTFDAGVVERSFTVAVVDNPVVEPDKTVRLELSNPQGGAVLGSLATATLTITDNDRVESYALNITPPIGGTVTPPSGSYPAGSSQVVTAVAERGFRFRAWEGTVSSTVNPLVLTMDRDYLLTADFVPTQYTYTFEPPFKASDLAQPPWISSSTRPWLLQSGVASAGSFAVRSGVIGDGQESTLQLLVNSRGGSAAFDVRVSSEANWDFAEFYVNGVRLQRWSGNVPWRTYRFSLTPGTHALAWRYVKDNNYASGLDAMFVDNLYVPDASPDPTDPAAQLRVVVVPGALQLWITGKAGLTYTLEQSPDLAVWTPVGDYPNPTGTVVVPQTVDPSKGAVFYRAVTTP